MGRPRTPIGAHGVIKTSEVTLATGRIVFEARCRFRAADGSLARMKRTGKSKAAAENALKTAVVKAVDEVRSGELKPSTLLKLVGEKWFAEEVEGRKAPKTVEVYRSYLERHIYPALGKLQMVEVDTVRCEALMSAKRRAGAKDDKLAGIRNVLSSVCAYAARHGALKTNPVRELSRLQRTERKEVRALTAAERKDMLAKLDADEKARELELADVLRGLLATGLRIAELLGCCGDDVLLDDPKKPKLRVAHRTIRIKGQGIVRVPRLGGPKGKAQEPRIPVWSVPLFRARKLASGGPGPLFGNRFGGWRSNDSVTSPLRQALDRIGYDWVTSHVMRKTVANVLRAAGIPLPKIAEQLGQASTAITERHYLEELPVSNEDQVEALEEMF